jgi:hypothetical protein
MMRRNPQAVLREIASDMKSDASTFEGQPFNGRTVAEYLGNLGAAVRAVALILDEHMDDKSAHEPQEP